MKYRPEIDGLRAIAVVSVVLAHAGVSRFQGGFVGVDVFFVISGYLITTLVLEERAKDRFTLSGFYFRRARRILPMLFLVMAVSVPFALWLLVPTQLTDFGRSMAAAAVFLSNAHFWEKTGYFDTNSELMPLLHTWSLAVEEQYYLLFPLFFLGVTRFFPRKLPYLLAVLVILSASLAEWGARNLPQQNFFFTFSRFWEILLGALCASLPRPTPNPKHGWLALAGLVLITSAILGFNEATPTPGLVALLPVSGAALVLVFGSQDGLAKRFLTLPLMIGLGAISYSIYLWHQPVFAFARLYYVTGVPVPVMAGLVGVVFGLSYLSWRYVEQPFRHGARFTIRRVFILSGGGMAGFVALGFWLHLSDLSQYRYAPEDLHMLTYDSYYRRYRDDAAAFRELSTCFGLGDGSLADVENCMGGQRDSVLFWGDSHAQALTGGAILSGLRPAMGLSAGCPPILGVNLNANPDCLGANNRIMEKLATRQTGGYVVLHANWTLYRDGKRVSFATDQELLDGVANTISRIRQENRGLRIILVGGVPQWGDSLPVYLYRLGLKLDKEQRIENPMSERIREINGQLRRIAAESGISYVDPFDILCNAEGCLATVKTSDGIFPTAWDYGHMTAEGASRLLQGMPFEASIAKAFR